MSDDAVLMTEVERALMLKFSIARATLRSRYKHDPTLKAAVSYTIGKTRMYQLLADKVPDEEFSSLIRASVIGILETASEQSIYGWINKKIEQQDLSFHAPSYISRLMGRYSYYRYYWTESRTVKRKQMQRGAINLRKENGFIYFDHSAAEQSVLGKSEDTGFCFVASERLYMMGFRKNNIRLAIARIPDDLAADPCRGVAVSTRRQKHDIFSSFFLMYHETHPNFNDLSEEEFKKSIVKHVKVEKIESFISVD